MLRFEGLRLNKRSPEQRHTVVFIDHSPKIGGASRVLLNLLKELDSSTIKPVVVCPETSELKKVLTERQISVTPAFMPWFTKKSGLFSWLMYGYALISFTFLIARLIKRNRILFIHANGFIAALYSVLPSRIFRIPVIWHSHELLDHGFVNAFFIKAAGRHAANIICVSEAVKKRLIEFGVNTDKCTVIYNFMPHIPDCSSLSRASSLSEFALPDHPRLIGMIGNISRLKGQLIFLEAIRKIADTHPDVYFLIIGGILSEADKPYRQDLVRSIEASGLTRKVIITGYRNDAFQLLQKFEFLVHPVTLPDSFPLVIQEAMYCGKAVIASKTGGIPEMIEDGISGFLIPPGDSLMLAKAIDELLREPGKCVEFGANGKKFLLNKFGQRGVIRALNRVYAQTVGARILDGDSRIGPSNFFTENAQDF